MFDELVAKLQDSWFLLLGLPAQLAFMSRFVIQWIASEKRGRSVIPLAFWYFSLFGTLGLAAYYVIGRHEPMGILGQILPVPIYVRNLVLVYRHRRNHQGAVVLGEMTDNPTDAHSE